ncbi:MAG: hypothetical protein R3314_03295 [Longimicrobiales bacterium]|nr:hypothetical protein [Longimicrobiales bacterium]
MILVVGVLVLVGGLRWIGQRPELPPADPARLDRIESALESLESRLASLQEQQRFLERLLDDRTRGALEAGPDPETPPDSVLFDTAEGEEETGR